ncbi:MAG: hypothetical protein AMJ92_06780 [candidate division Zixibacteria bacterium SM23_81]|nr:MAG: hypothetical protein AMJ92_06780 [candidate division Zixibacteria bacterium SM23_81]
MGKLAQRTIFSVGSSNRSAEELFCLLAQHHIRRLVDVRRFPISRWPHFSRKILASLAERRGLEYFYLGDLLGGYRAGGYVQHLKTAEFRLGLDRLERLALERKVVFLCAERFPWRCHRRFIATALEDLGWRVVHIIDQDRTWRSVTRRECDEQAGSGQVELNLPG